VDFFRLWVCGVWCRAVPLSGGAGAVSAWQGCIVRLCPATLHTQMRQLARPRQLLCTRQRRPSERVKRCDRYSVGFHVPHSPPGPETKPAALDRSPVIYFETARESCGSGRRAWSRAWSSRQAPALARARFHLSEGEEGGEGLAARGLAGLASRLGLLSRAAPYAGRWLAGARSDPTPSA
jgi:hypothetical protein